MMDHFIMMDRSRDLSTIEKTFAQGRIMHLQSIFHYGDFINAAIRECSFHINFNRKKTKKKHVL